MNNLQITASVGEADHMPLVCRRASNTLTLPLVAMVNSRYQKCLKPGDLRRSSRSACARAVSCCERIKSLNESLIKRCPCDGHVRRHWPLTVAIALIPSSGPSAEVQFQGYRSGRIDSGIRITGQVFFLLHRD